MTVILFIAGLVADLWLLIIFHRQKVRNQLPWFVLYMAWEVLLASVQLVAWLASPRVYIAVYWWMEAVAVILIVGAVRESFLRIFEGFTSKPGFRWTLSLVIAGVVLYSAWKAVFVPPVHGSQLEAFVVGAEFAFRWGIAAIGILTVVLSFLLKEPASGREDAVVTGFMIASVGFLVSVINFSLFGTKYLLLTKYAPPVGYFAAVFLWIWAFSRPADQFGLKELGMGPEDIRSELRRYGKINEQMMGKKW